MANNLVYKDQKFAVGDTIRVSALVKESEDKERVQIFEGVLIGVKGEGANKSFTVRKIGADAIGVERIWPVSSPKVTAVTLKKAGQVRRAKLYYLRSRIGKKATKIKEASSR